MAEAAGDATDVVVVTDLNITGKPAQFGRGVMQDVSDKLLGQFVACLEQRLQAPEEGATGGAAEAGVAGAVPTAEPPRSPCRRRPRRAAGRRRSRATAAATAAGGAAARPVPRRRCGRSPRPRGTPPRTTR